MKIFLLGIATYLGIGVVVFVRGCREGHVTESGATGDFVLSLLIGPWIVALLLLTSAFTWPARWIYHRTKPS